MTKHQIQEGIPSGHTFAQWVGVELINHARIPAHDKVTFGIVDEPDRAGHWHWKGLTVDWDGQHSKLIPTTLDIKASNHC